MAVTPIGNTDPARNLQQGFNNIYSMFGPTQSGQGGGGGNQIGQGLNLGNISSGGGNQIGQGLNLGNISSGGQSNSLFGGTPITGGYQNQPMSGAGSPYGVAPQPMSGADNSLTAFFYGLSNLLGTTAPSFIQAGENLIQGGLPSVQQGLGQQNQGFQTTQQALATMAPGLNYQLALLNNDPNALSSVGGATNPTLAQQNANILNQMQQGVPKGGYSATVTSQLPQTLATAAGVPLLQAKPGAAAALQAAGPQISGIGTQQAGIGSGVSQTGLNVSQLGEQLANLGFSNVQNAIQDMLQKMGYNIQGGTANLMSNVMTGIGSMIGGARG